MYGFIRWIFCMAKRTIDFVRQKYGDTVKIGAGNVVDKGRIQISCRSWSRLYKSWCWWRFYLYYSLRQKELDVDKQVHLIDVVTARDEYFNETGVYIPICSDGGIVHDHHITIALALGADFCNDGKIFCKI